MARTYEEELIDQFLLLFLVYDANKTGKDIKRTKIHKLTFLSEWSMINKKIKGFTYTFIKLKHGPFSSEVKKDLSNLVENKLLDRGLELTDRGIEIVGIFWEVLKRNKKAIQKIIDTNKEYAGWSLGPLLEYVYSLPHPYIKGHPRIRDLKNTTPILYKISDEKAKEKFAITPAERDSLDLYLDLKKYQFIKESTESAKREPLHLIH